MTMPDVIYAKVISVYEICCPACWLKQWDEDDNKDGSEPYYSQSKVDELIEQAHMAGQADAGVDPGYSNARAYRINLKIGDSDDL